MLKKSELRSLRLNLTYQTISENDGQQSHLRLVPTGKKVIREQQVLKKNEYIDKDGGLRRKRESVNVMRVMRRCSRNTRTYYKNNLLN